MDRYKNLNGGSGVVAYEISNDSIMVEFNNNSLYLYSYLIPGQQHVDNMKGLAVRGYGLNGYINSYVKKQYEKRLR